jgi:RNA ligase (TIGR02306 family)
MRKLATVRVIKEVNPIDGADKIECVIVDGWQVVTKKGEFSPGDLCVYFEIDSVLPIREEFEFLRKGCYVKKDWLESEHNPTGEGFRLKTIRLRKQISQGLVIPFEDYMEVDDDFYEGADVSNHLEVVKWDPPVPATLSGKVRGNFPAFLRKTDQERVQNLKMRDFEDYRYDHFEVTTKLDGSSMTVYRYNDDGDVKSGVCSRNLDLDIEEDPDTTFARVAEDNQLLRFFDEHDISAALQGELMGPGIQGNREGLKDHAFFIFDVYDIKLKKYLSATARYALLSSLNAWQINNNIIMTQHAPVIGLHYTLESFIKDDRLDINAFLEFAEGPSISNDVREGVVFKSERDPNFSFKAISNEFLLSGGD